MKGQNMGKQTKAQRIAELETHLEEARRENAKWDERQERTARDLRIARGELNRIREEERRQKSIADRKAREAEREVERKRLDDLSNGVVDLSKIKHDFGFDYDHATSGGTVTITLHASDREAKILNAYATKGRTELRPNAYRMSLGAPLGASHEVWDRLMRGILAA